MSSHLALADAGGWREIHDSTLTVFQETSGGDPEPGSSPLLGLPPALDWVVPGISPGYMGCRVGTPHQAPSFVLGSIGIPQGLSWEQN